MARIIRRRWETMLDAGLPRRDRQPCEYEAYLPDALVGRAIVLDGDVAADAADAEAAIIRLNAEATVLADTEALARLLLRAESVASSRIEGLEMGARRLLRAEAALGLGEQPRDVTAAEVLGNIDAMAWSVRTISEGATISAESIVETHRRLLAGTRLAQYAGQLRTIQNWIGGSAYNPCSAEFVPPPPELVPELLDDLCAFCNSDGLPPVAQAAVAHAQFETIHPFADGNGRTGRALIHMVLRRRGLIPRVLPPVSLILATRAAEYVHALSATRYRGAATSPPAHEGTNRWIALFASACVRAVADARSFEERTSEIEQAWRSRIGHVRKDSAADRLLRALRGAPVITVNSASDLVGRSYEATNNGVNQLVASGVLSPITVGQRNRAFEAPEIIDAFTALERRLASPAADTRVAAPTRPAPRRRS